MSQPIHAASVPPALCVLGDFAWNGSDLYVDGLEIRNNRNPVVLGGGNTRCGTVKVFYSESSVAVRVSSSRLIASLIEVQDAANHGIDIASADCLIGALRIDSAGRSTPNGDALLLNAGGAMLPAVQIIDRGANSYRTRNGIVANAASGAVIDAQVGAGLTGATYTGPAVTAMAGLRVNGRQIVPAQTAVSADLTALVARIAALEAAGVNVDTSLRAIDAAISDLDNRADALDVRQSDTQNQLGAHASWAMLRHADHAAAYADAAARLAALEQHDQAAAATLPALDAVIATVNAKSAPNSLAAFREMRATIAKTVGA